MSTNRIRTLAIVLGVLVVLLLLLPSLIPVNQFRSTVEEKLSAALDRKVHVGNLSLSLWSGALAAEELSIADDAKFSAAPFLTAKALKVKVEVMALIFSRALHITGLTIEKPEVTLLRDAAGRWNFSSLGGAPAKSEPRRAAQAPAQSSDAAAELLVQKMELKDGRLLIGTMGSAKRASYDNVNAEASDVSMSAAFPAKVTASLPGGGSFKLEGRVGPLNPNDASLSPVDAKISIDGLDLASTGVIDAAAGLGGILDLDATLTSQKGEVQTKGTMKLKKLLLVAGGSPSTVPVTLDFSTKSDMQRNTGVLNPSAIKVGNAAARIAGTYETRGEATVVNLKFAGQDMPARDLQGFLPALGINLPKGASLSSGMLSGDLNIQGPTNRLITSGTLGLANARVSGFDLGSKLAVISALAGVKTGSDLDIEKLTTKIRMAPDGLRAENFNAVIPALGTLVGAGTVDAKNNLDFKMLATLTGGPAAAGTTGGAGAAPAGGAATTGGGGVAGMLGALLGPAKGGQARRIPFLIQGTASDPKFVPDVQGLATEMLKSQFSGSGAQKDTQQPDSGPLGGLGELFKKKKP
ncbi:MAG: AsmA family protein [Acidobacteriia bacterium]|nr:AsmA family protein [Terriglobia bacterium]